MTDSNEVKELIELLKKETGCFNCDMGTFQEVEQNEKEWSEDLAQAILQAGYTKNKGEKVWEGQVHPKGFSNVMFGELSAAFKKKKIKVYIEVQS